jgi:hypothetical protein
MPSDRETSLKAYAAYFISLSEEVAIAMQLLGDLSAYTSPEHMRELRDTFAGALAAVDRAAREECAALCEATAEVVNKTAPTHPTPEQRIAISRIGDTATDLANAIRRSIR